MVGSNDPSTRRMMPWAALVIVLLCSACATGAQREAARMNEATQVAISDGKWPSRSHMFAAAVTEKSLLLGFVLVLNLNHWSCRKPRHHDGAALGLWGDRAGSVW